MWVLLRMWTVLMWDWVANYWSNFTVVINLFQRRQWIRFHCWFRLSIYSIFYLIYLVFYSLLCFLFFFCFFVLLHSWSSMRKCWEQQQHSCMSSTFRIAFQYWNVLVFLARWALIGAKMFQFKQTVMILMCLYRFLGQATLLLSMLFRATWIVYDRRCQSTTLLCRCSARGT